MDVIFVFYLGVCNLAAGAPIQLHALPPGLQPPGGPAVQIQQPLQLSHALPQPLSGTADVVKLFAFFTSEFRHFLGHMEQCVQVWSPFPHSCSIVAGMRCPF